MSEELPGQIISFDQIRINRSLEKICKCDNRKFVVDTQNRRITCQGCGSVVDPYDAMYKLARNGERLQEQVEQLLEQRKQIANYKPWLVTIKSLEKQYRGRKMMPLCPACDEPFMLEELSRWVNWQFNEKRVMKRIQDSQDN